MPRRRAHRVGDVAEQSGVSIRTLHHYDEIGLLRPSARSASGYRLYDDADLLRLQQILIGRELGLSLEQIRRSLDDPAFDRRTALLEQRAALERRAARATRMIEAIDAALGVLDEIAAARTADTTAEATTEAATMNEKRNANVDMKKIFDGFDPAEYEDEVKERWGGTEAYEVSRRRAASYTEEDWKRFREEQGAIYSAALAALAAGDRPDSPEAMDVAERHRLSIDRWFYPCSPKMHAGLADLWEADDRFRKNIDKHGAGLTAFLAAAVRANAERARSAPGARHEDSGSGS
ncbi:MAG TPA: MerR family transcriptional regulator [Gammaproteobacteria bacterium]|nr:MerR family transcriptional regulator [Gammaproteobacteria bacterium]